ncbi:hypothetical protein AB0J21_18025 [Streptomyces sp. NPDC049954]
MRHLALAAWHACAAVEAPEKAGVVDTGAGRVVFPPVLHETLAG